MYYTLCCVTLVGLVAFVNELSVFQSLARR